MLLRSLLFVPGNRPNMLDKARPVTADVLTLDLEDAVPLAEKEAARTLVRQSLSSMARPGRSTFVRINSLGSGLAPADLEAVVAPGLDGINLPKAESAQDVDRVASLLSALEKARGLEANTLKIIAWIESARGLLQSYHIVSASPRVVGLALGADDYTLDMGMVRSESGEELFYPRSVIAVAATAAGIAPLDTPYVNYKDEAGLIKDASFARQLGFKGKFLIHPGQAEPVNRIFSPSAAEVEQARKVVAAFDQAVARGTAATSVDGKMVDIPVAERARKLLALAEAIANSNKGGKD
ncbi:MAG: CoA ester lyase [Chloroflexi bacterium]|nr:CoA ester lyase [Chloroflexota bacterium]